MKDSFKYSGLHNPEKQHLLLMSHFAIQNVKQCRVIRAMTKETQNCLAWKGT